MPWGSPVLGAQLTTVRVGTLPSVLSRDGLRLSVSASPTIEQYLQSPLSKGKLVLTSDNYLVAAGSSPEFPMVPKWRKVSRQIG